MDQIEKKIEKLKQEKDKIDDKIVSLKKKSDGIVSNIEELENQRIVSIVKRSGISLDDLVTTISIFNSDKLKSAKQEEKQNEI